MLLLLLPLRMKYTLTQAGPLALPLSTDHSLGNAIYQHFLAPYLEETMQTAWLIVQRYAFRLVIVEAQPCCLVPSTCSGWEDVIVGKQ
jgi:hypothetical protein